MINQKTYINNDGKLRRVLKPAGYVCLFTTIFLMGRCSVKQPQKNDIFVYERNGTFMLSTPEQDLPLYHVRSKPQLGSLDYRLEGLLYEHPDDLADGVKRLKEREQLLHSSGPISYPSAFR
jgi:hypothetical protein